MSKSSDVRYGRRGGHEVPAGVVPGDGLADIDALRAAALAEGTWPTADDDEGGGDQLPLF